MLAALSASRSEESVDAYRAPAYRPLTKFEARA